MKLLIILALFGAVFTAPDPEAKAKAQFGCGFPYPPAYPPPYQYPPYQYPTPAPPPAPITCPANQTFVAFPPPLGCNLGCVPIASTFNYYAPLRYAQCFGGGATRNYQFIPSYRPPGCMCTTGFYDTTTATCVTTCPAGTVYGFY